MRTTIALCMWALAASGEAAAQQTQRFTLSGDRVAIVNLAGEIRVEGATGSEVVVEVLRQGEDADRLTVRTSDYNGWRTLRIDYPSDRIVYPRLGRFSRTEFDLAKDGMPGGRALRATLDENGFTVPSSIRLGLGHSRVRVSGSGSGLEAFADLHVRVPRGRTIALQLGVGRVTVANVDGHVRVDNRSGSVSASQVNGSLLIDTGSGSVSVASAHGHVRIDTGSGSVRADDIDGGSLLIDTGSGGVDVAALDVTALGIDTGSGSIRVDDANAPELRLETGSGGIRVHRTHARDVELDTGSGSIVLELLSDVRSARLDTGSGSVTLLVPHELGAELVVDTGSGGISVDAPLQVSQKRRTHLRGRIGDGQGLISIDTGSGGVSLRSR